MNTRTLVLLSLFVGIGAVLHTVIPGFFFGMKPDMMLTMMFLGIMLFPNKTAVSLLAIATGIISGVTTSFPGGFIPNIVDKVVTAALFFGLFTLLKAKATPVKAALLTAVGTFISGATFLAVALAIVGLPGGATFGGLFVAVVIPTAFVNTIAMIVIYPIVQSLMRRTYTVSQQ
ncbi:tryptophan transporter [Anoxybacillus kestanbolensis]|uniref:Tryptophan transporter n=1 Tax=Anoxybacillus kestanbolensis TaxID=227476 RepID=A0A1V3FXP4_9BACL|nr:tryptophan transporter [Anoxybacillus kestanbolensis]OOE06361.1 tryptophan transporter [Anoxybacillus kestanbolensis]